MQMTSIGRHGGLQGLCGPDSILFYAFPVIAYAISRLRPDLVVHVVAENAGSTRHEHRVAMQEALGLSPDGSHVQLIDAADWAHMPRRRIFLSTLPVDNPTWRPERRTVPWEHGWAPRPDGSMPAMLRARGATGSTRASTYQYHPRHLLYSRSGDWFAGDILSAGRRIRQLLPTALHEGWRLICTGGTRSNEAPAERVAEWIDTHGRQHGFRTPTVQERARCIGHAGYQLELGLTPRQLFDGQGNHFDPAAVVARIAGSVLTWIRGGLLHRHRFPAPDEVCAAYDMIRAQVDARGLAVQPSPFPMDLVDKLNRWPL